MVIESIVNNIPALQIINQLRKTDNDLSTNLERLSTGLRINSPKDDPGDFVFSRKLESQFRGLARASDNTQTAINMVNTATGAVDQIIELLNDIRESAVAASGGSAAEQAVIQEKLEELNSIANTTRFGNKFLLNGALSSNVDFKSGTRDFGGSLSFGPNASTLLDGRSFLNIGVETLGSAQIQQAGDATFNTGLTVASDIAVTSAQFLNGGAAAGTGDTLNTLSLNRVGLQTNGSIGFSGTLADGETFFSGTFSIGGASTVQDLIDDIQATIDAQESDLGIEGSGTLETEVGLDGNGRLQFTSGTSQEISEFSADFTVRNSGNTLQTTFSTTRADTIFNPLVGGTATTAQIGNNTTSVTGSTFDTGTFTIDVSNVTAAQQRQITTIDEFDRNNGGAPVFTTTSLSGSILNGTTIANGDTFQINGTDPDGTTFTSTLTVGNDTGVGDGLITTYDDFIAELNNRDRSLSSFGFNGATATLTGSGQISLFDDIENESSTDLQMIFTDVSAPATQTLNSNINTAGSAETATISIDGGSTQQVEAGQVVTLEGSNISGGPNPQVTFRVGSGFTAGNDELDNTANQFRGRLNDGTEVVFQNGDQNVTFKSGSSTLGNISEFQQVTLDFDAIVDITTLDSSGGETFVISSTTGAANFQLGGNGETQKLFLFGDLTSDNLGSSSGATLDDIDVTTASGATEAVTIVDDALDQVNNFNARLGAFASRLDDTVSALDSAALDIETAFTDIVSADIAKEASELSKNTILLQAQSAVLIQANSTPTSVYEVLFGLNG